MLIQKTLIGIAIVAGCLQSAAAAKPPSSSAEAGHDVHWGDPPSGTGFTAGLNYTALVYMQLRTTANNELSWKIEHSIFKTQNIVDAATLDKRMQKIIDRQGRRSNNCSWNHNDEAECGMKADSKRPNKRAYRDLQDNLFVNQNVRYYIVIDNEGVRFDEVWPLMFTQFSAGARAFADDAEWLVPANGVMRKANDAYKNARIGGASGVMGENVVYFENLNPNPTVDAKYSMNLNLWMAVAGSKHEIPVIIDPDTGNGNNRPPPANP